MGAALQTFTRAHPSPGTSVTIFLGDHGLWVAYREMPGAAIIRPRHVGVYSPMFGLVLVLASFNSWLACCREFLISPKYSK